MPKSGNPFRAKRHEQQGQMMVESGFRRGEFQYRIFLPGASAVSLTPEQANDLADCLDTAIDKQEQDPLL